MDSKEKKEEIKEEIKSLKQLIASQESWIKILEKALEKQKPFESSNDLSTDKIKAIRERELLYKDMVENAKEIVDDCRSELDELMFGDLESQKNYHSIYGYCEACQQSPCLCSDPERSSTTWNM